MGRDSTGKGRVRLQTMEQPTREHISSLFPTLGIVATILVIAVTVLSLIKFKMEITRDRLGWHRKSAGRSCAFYIILNTQY